jgi:N6-adenosine-specific RNA methylase IME4
VTKQYLTILADPPWQVKTVGRFQRHAIAPALPYPTMSVDEICALPVSTVSAQSAHLWLWTCNQFLEAGFQVMRAWGFKYLAPVTWVKPSGCGPWFVHTTQTLLFGYRGKCAFPLDRYKRTDFRASAQRHSRKPEASYELIEAISPAPRLELFARVRRPGWHVWGNEVHSDIQLIRHEEIAA